MNLSGTKVTDVGLVHLTGLTCLRDLNLDGTNISGKGLKHLMSLYELKYLSLKGTRVTDKDLVHLNQLPELRVVDLNGTGITTVAVEKMLRKGVFFDASEQGKLSENRLKDGGSDEKMSSENVSTKIE